MTSFMYLYSNFIIFLFVLIPLEITTHHRHQHRLKSLHFALYQHKTINETGYFVVKGVGGPPISHTVTPFGTLFVSQDPSTLKPNYTSKVVGMAEGTTITSGLDGLQGISTVEIALNVKKHRGLTLIVGGTNDIKPSNHYVVGGTDDILSVQGYVTSSLVMLHQAFLLATLCTY